MSVLLFVPGILSLLFCIMILPGEMKRRHYNSKSLLHTVVVALNDEFPPYHISSSQITIGRRRRRCEISISGNSEANGYISRTHASLWWDGNEKTFRIAPIYTKHLDGTVSKPVVLVNGETADKNGLEVLYGDIVTLGECKFTLKDTRKGEVL